MEAAEAFMQEFVSGRRDPKPAPSLPDLWEMAESPSMSPEHAARLMAQTIQTITTEEDSILIEYRLDGPMKSTLVVPFSEFPPEARQDPIPWLLAVLKADVRAAAIKARHHQIPGG